MRDVDVFYTNNKGERVRYIGTLPESANSRIRKLAAELVREMNRRYSADRQSKLVEPIGKDVAIGIEIRPFKR